MDRVEITIHNREEDKYYQVDAAGSLIVEYERKGTPGRLTFYVINDKILKFAEGDSVQVAVDGKPYFYGIVFTRSRDRDNIVAVTAYDILRYLKNKAIYNFTGGITAGEAIKRMAQDFEVPLGEIADTKVVIPRRRASNECIIDTMQTFLDITTKDSGQIYVLFADFDKLCLKNIENMEVPILIDNETAENFGYESTIDKATYNRVKLYYDNKDTGKRDVWIAQDGANMKRWGVLQLTQDANPDKGASPSETAKKLLEYHNIVQRSLTIKGSFGDVRVRAGSMLFVKLKLDDVTIEKEMIVESVKHTFTNHQHSMDMELRGGVITG